MFLKGIIDATDRHLTSIGMETQLSHLFQTEKMERPGEIWSKKGATVVHPVVFIPGIVSTGLEVWQGEQCARSNSFRKRIWGSYNMFSQLTPWNRYCWLNHMKLNETTWQDPEGIRVRPSQGLGAADVFVTESLSDVGYTTKNMHMASYDWRLAFDDLERRDGYFTELKRKIETMYINNQNKKIVVVSHSMGSPVYLHFMQWISNIDQQWVNKYICTWANVAGSLIGAPKALSAALSAEMRDTAELGAVQQWAKGAFFHRDDLLRTLRSWGSLPSLFPRGGTQIWGDSSSARGRMITFNVTDHHIQTVAEEKRKFEKSAAAAGEDDLNEKEMRTWAEALQHFLNKEKRMREEALQDWKESDSDVKLIQSNSSSSEGSSLGTGNSVAYSVLSGLVSKIPFVQQQYNGVQQTLASAYNWYSTVPTADGPILAKATSSTLSSSSSSSSSANGANQEVNLTTVHYDVDAIVSLLRQVAPEYMALVDDHYSFGYEAKPPKAGTSHSKHWSNPLTTQLPYAPNMAIACLYGVGKPTERSYAFKFNSSDLEIDHTNNQGSFGAGVGCEDGDGTVPLESLGFVCQSEKIWKGKTEHNPSGMKVKTKEYRHAKYNKLDMGGSSPMSAFIQGGPSSADHVDILGNYLLIGDLLDIVTKEGIGGVEEMESVIHSELMEMVEEVDKQL